MFSYKLATDKNQCSGIERVMNHRNGCQRCNQFDPADWAVSWDRGYQIKSVHRFFCSGLRPVTTPAMIPILTSANNRLCNFEFGAHMHASHRWKACTWDSNKMWIFILKKIGSLLPACGSIKKKNQEGGSGFEHLVLAGGHNFSGGCGAEVWKGFNGR